MKDKFAEFLVTKSRIILIISIILALGFGVIIPFVNVNKDMTKYLPADSSMRHGLDLMEAEFGKEDSSTLLLMFSDLSTDDEKLAIEGELKTLPHVDSVDYKLPEKDEDGDYNKGSHTLYVINADCGQYSDQGTALWEEVNERYGEDHDISLGGTIDNANHSGLPLWIAVSAVALIFLVLLLMANSWVEPIAFLATVGVAVLINMGSYIFFPSISHTTFGIVAILQLALSMDYSIMLLNRYRQQRLVCPDKHQAMSQALGLSFGAITGSSLTTFAGLLALLFMRFGIGSDIGLALAKGVLISLLCIFTVLPSMLLALDSLMLRTPKPTPPFDLPGFSRFQFRSRVPLALLFAGLFIAGLIIRGGVDFSYAQYGSGDAIAEVFGHDNTIVMVYNEKDGKTAADLSDMLEERDDIKSAVCYESTLGKSRTAEDMKGFMDDMQEESDTKQLSTSMLRLVYYDYFAGDSDLRMTIPGFVSFLQGEVLNDADFKDTIDSEMRSKINDMAKFTDVGTLTSAKTASGLADFFGMGTKEARQLLLYYEIKRGHASAGKMTVPGFISFLIDDVAGDPDYGSMISRKQLKQLKSMRIYTNKEEMTKSRTYEETAGILNMDADHMRLVYVYDNMGEAADKTMTITDLAAALKSMSEDPVLQEQFGGDDTAQLIAGLEQVGQMDSEAYNVNGMEQALSGYDMPLDAQTLSLIYSYADVAGDKAAHTASVQEIISFMLSNEAISGSMSDGQKEQLRSLKKIIDASVKGSKLSPSGMSSILGMKKSDVRSIYLLKKYKSGNTGSWKATPQQFINFLVDTVLSDSAMKKRVGSSADDLRLAQKLINNSVAGTKYSCRGLADLLGEYSEDMSAEDISLLYELYGSKHLYDDSWSMNLMQFVSHLDDKMISRPAFANAMDENDIADVHEMRSDMDEAAGKLEGEHYGRMMITANLDEDSDETRRFMDQMTEWSGGHFEHPYYLIGTTPMAYETSQTFHSELNRVTLLTALFVFIIVLLTFRNLVTSAILVLIIQCAVFLTMAVLNLLHIDMNYLALLIVQSIMMGATIDYAIVYTSYYIENRIAGPPDASGSRIDAIRGAYKGSLQTILTSATILIAAVGVLSFAFEEPGTRQICRILSVGCLIATVLVVFMLPGILACLDRVIIRKNKN